MTLHNKNAVLIVAFFVGMAANLDLIYGTSFLLSHADAVYTLYAIVPAGILFSALLATVEKFKRKFSFIAVVCLTVLALAHFFLLFGVVSDFFKGLVWFFLAVFSLEFLIWTNSELALRHLDPARARSYFSYISAFLEIGTVIILLTFKLYEVDISANQALITVTSILVVSLLFILFHFCPRRNFEVRFAKSDEEFTVTQNLKAVRAVLFSFLLLTLLCVAVEFSGEYQIKIVLQNYSQDFAKINDVVEWYSLIASFLTIVVGLTMGYFIQKKRTSPYVFFYGHLSITLLVAVVCLVTHNFYAFIVYEIIRNISFYGLFSPAVDTLVSAFDSHTRQRIRSLYNLLSVVVIPVVFTILYSWTRSFAYETGLTIVVSIIVACLLLGFGAAVLSNKEFVVQMRRYLHSANKTAAVTAAHMLSYVRPSGYLDEMKEILKGNPRTLLQKTIILGLGYVDSSDSVDVIRKAFHSEKEEIQLASLDALKVSNQYGAKQFMINVLEARVRSKSLRVRLNASAFIASMYGKVSVPFLLNGLDSREPRIVANTLESLSYFREKQLIPVFKEHVKSPFPRIRANSLIGLYRYRKTRKLYAEIVDRELSGNDYAHIASIIYVVGKLRDKARAKRILNFYRQETHLKHPKITNTLGWALARLNLKEGFDLFSSLLVRFSEKKKDYEDLMHLFSQFPREARFDIIKYLVSHYCETREQLSVVSNKFKETAYDFHEELEYLEHLGELIPPHREMKLQQAEG